MKGSMKNGHGFVCTLPGKYYGWQSLGKEGRKDDSILNIVMKGGL